MRHLGGSLAWNGGAQFSQQGHLHRKGGGCSHNSSGILVINRGTHQMTKYTKNNGTSFVTVRETVYKFGNRKQE